MAVRRSRLPDFQLDYEVGKQDRLTIHPHARSLSIRRSRKISIVEARSYSVSVHIQPEKEGDLPILSIRNDRIIA